MTEVYFSDLTNKKFNSPLNKINRLLAKCNIDRYFNKDELIALKLHFGEFGNTAFIRPIYLRPIIDILKKKGAKPFLVDTNTLYIGMRTNSVDHLHNAFYNGFNFSTLQTPVIIADGLRGENSIEIEVNLEIKKSVKLASDIYNADGMIVLTHFKGHEATGIGGAIKNISMGCASRQGKMDMHSESKPFVTRKKCTVCKRCITNCQVNAIEIKEIEKRERAYINQDKCVGCARCIAVCPAGAIGIKWNTSPARLQQKMVEYSYAIHKKFESKIIYINFLTDISPACDCYGGNDKPLVPNIGFLASLDPIAIDRASYDLVIEAAGEDPFKKIYPELEPGIIFDHAAKLDFGSGDYELIKID